MYETAERQSRKCGPEHRTAVIDPRPRSPHSPAGRAGDFTLLQLRASAPAVKGREKSRAPGALVRSPPVPRSSGHPHTSASSVSREKSLKCRKSRNLDLELTDVQYNIRTQLYGTSDSERSPVPTTVQL
eukprot:4664577-Prymnesium_polylepis.1